MADEANSATVIGGGLVAIGLTIGGYFVRGVEVWWKSRPAKATPEQRARATADLDKIAVEMASQLMDGMRSDIEDLREEMKAMKRDHAAEIADLKSSHLECEERCTLLTGEVRKLQASNKALDRMIAKLKRPASTNIGGELEGAIFELSGGEVKDVSGRPTVNKDIP